MSITFILLRAIQLYTYVIFGAVIISWLPIPRDNPLVRLLNALTDPVLEPFRRLLPPEKTGGLDVSPIFALMALQLLSRLLVGM